MSTPSTPEIDAAQLAGDYEIDPVHSRIGFVARHAMVTKVRGSFNTFTGTFHIDGENPGNSSAQVSISVDSIDTRNADRDGHLRSSDFLDIETHPEITFRSTAATQTGPASLDLTGDLTIRGTTQQVTIPFTFEGQAKDPFGNIRIGFEGSSAVNRKDFGMTFNAVLETGGVLVSDRIVLEFEVSAVKKEA